ncbi:MAG TPA: L,D-transpeptidase [Xanthobacteraceae bacterium]|nr:L,D-transpeptidase [Xanthobacteraceae bacterium]
MTASVYALGFAVALTLAPPASAKVRHKPEPKDIEHVSKDPFGPLPKGPMQIVISINQQKLHLYADGKEVADTLVATGVPTLPTPTGIFSVLGKERFHRSNIYSGAPMPFMQRITWSGVALHEGENIGHPASHGCIRMPREFAMKLFSVTKVGVRVIIARNELKPVPFADAHLFVHKAMPAPAPAAAAPAAPEATRTAQAGDDNKKTDAVALPKSETPAAAAPAAPEPAKTVLVSDKTIDASAPPKPEAAATAAPAATDSAAQPGDEQAKLQPLATAEAKAAAPASQQDGLAKIVAAPPAPPSPPAATDKLRGTAATPAVALQNPADAAPAPAPADKPTTLVDTGHATTQGPISIFVSRKEKKIYVRQNFSPLFYAPVTIDHPEHPFGTHVFTAMAYLDDGATLRWNVVSLPGEPPKAKRDADNGRRTARNGRREEPVAKPVGELPPPQTPAEALARIDIPQDAIDRISAMLVPGSSLVVSDQGLGEETGEGTDFIVVTR